MCGKTHRSEPTTAYYCAYYCQLCWHSGTTVGWVDGASLYGWPVQAILRQPESMRLRERLPLMRSIRAVWRPVPFALALGALPIVIYAAASPGASLFR
jgi:hypothetical protein